MMQPCANAAGAAPSGTSASRIASPFDQRGLFRVFIRFVPVPDGTGTLPVLAIVGSRVTTGITNHKITFPQCGLISKSR